MTQRPKVIAVRLWHVAGHICRPGLYYEANSHIWIHKHWCSFTRKLQKAHNQTHSQKYSQTSLPLFLRSSTLLQSRLGVGPAADNKPTVVEYSLCQPIRTAPAWIAANDNMFSTAGGRELLLTQEKKSGNDMQQIGVACSSSALSSRSKSDQILVVQFRIHTCSLPHSLFSFLQSLFIF